MWESGGIAPPSLKLGTGCMQVVSLPADRVAESGFGYRWKIFGSPKRTDRLKIFKLNRKDWPSSAEWLGLGRKVLYSRHMMILRKKIKSMQHSRAPVPLPDLRAPITCTGFPHPRPSALSAEKRAQCHPLLHLLPHKPPQNDDDQRTNPTL